MPYLYFAPSGYLYSGYFGYLIWMLPIILLSAIASGAVQSNYNRYSKVLTRRGITGAQVAEMILHANGIYDVRVTRVSGRLSDHYHPTEKYIGLSDGVFQSTSVAALGIAAHEAGHAVQYHQSYAPIRFRGAILPVANFASHASWILIFLGLVFSDVLALAGILLFAVVVLFQLITLPVEFNASRRAISVLEQGGYLAEDELVGAKKVLKAAAMTYVVALLTSLWQMFRYILIIFNGRSRR